MQRPGRLFINFLGILFVVFLTILLGRGFQARSLPDLKPGKYRVTWRAVSLDTHVTTGDFKFEFVGSTTSLRPLVHHT